MQTSLSVKSISYGVPIYAFISVKLPPVSSPLAVP
jgi:hypothetical protein